MILQNMQNRFCILGSLIALIFIEASCSIILENQRVQNFYGNVIDQNGQPIVEADVAGNIEIMNGLTVAEIKTYKTQTDSHGHFQFIHLHGSRLNASVSKSGYEINYGRGQIMSKGSTSNPTNRVTFVMWKLKGPETMTHGVTHTYIPCDGSSIHIDLLTGRNSPDGDLIVTVIRNPLNIDRRKPFNWSVTLEIPNGGMQTITNMYPNEAPVEGYQEKTTFSFYTNTPNWAPNFHHSFYFKNKAGQIYGRMSVNIIANFQPPPTSLSIETYANPAGSRNLEFDSRK